MLTLLNERNLTRGTHYGYDRKTGIVVGLPINYSDTQPSMRKNLREVEPEAQWEIAGTDGVTNLEGVAALLESEADFGDQVCLAATEFITHDIDDASEDLDVDYSSIRSGAVAFLRARDVSPDTVLTCSNGYVKVADALAALQLSYNLSSNGATSEAEAVMLQLQDSLGNQLEQYVDPETCWDQVRASIQSTEVYAKTLDACLEVRDESVSLLDTLKTRFAAVTKNTATLVEEVLNAGVIGQGSVLDVIRNCLARTGADEQNASDDGWTQSNTFTEAYTGCSILAAMNMSAFKSAVSMGWTMIKTFVGGIFKGIIAAVTGAYDEVRSASDSMNFADINPTDIKYTKAYRRNANAGPYYLDLAGTWSWVLSATAIPDDLQADWLSHFCGKSFTIRKAFGDIIVKYPDATDVEFLSDGIPRVKGSAAEGNAALKIGIQLKPVDFDILHATPLVVNESAGITMRFDVYGNPLAGSDLYPTPNIVGFRPLHYGMPDDQYDYSRWSITSTEVDDWLSVLQQKGAFAPGVIASHTCDVEDIYTFGDGSQDRNVYRNVLNEGYVYNCFACSKLLAALWLSVCGPIYSRRITDFTGQQPTQHNAQPYITFGFSSSPSNWKQWPNNADWMRHLFGVRPSTSSMAYRAGLATVPMVPLSSEGAAAGYTNGLLERLSRTFVSQRQSDFFTSDFYYMSYVTGGKWMQPAWTVKTDSNNLDEYMQAAAQVTLAITAAVVVTVAVTLKLTAKARFWKKYEYVGQTDNAIWNGQKLTRRQKKKYTRYKKKLDGVSLLTSSGSSAVSGLVGKFAQDEAPSQDLSSNTYTAITT